MDGSSLTIYRMLSSGHPRTPKQPRRSNAPMSPQSPLKRPYALHRARPRKKTKARQPMAASTAGSLPTTTPRAPATANTVPAMSLAGVNPTTTSTIWITFLARQTLRPNRQTLGAITHRTHTEQARSTGGQAGTTWRATQKCWRGQGMRMLQAVRGLRTGSSRGCKNLIGYEQVVGYIIRRHGWLGYTHFRASRMNRLQNGRFHAATSLVGLAFNLGTINILHVLSQFFFSFEDLTLP